MKAQKFKPPKSSEWPKDKIKEDVKELRTHMDNIIIEKLANKLGAKK